MRGDGIEYILFDLDGTLYTDATGLFSEVGRRIIDWLAQVLAISTADATTLRRTYNQAYGTTMAGLRHHHPELNVDDFLDYVHDIDVDPYLNPNPMLSEMLASLERPKSVFTNSIAIWAEKITNRLGIRDYFEHVFDVRYVRYQCKPHPNSYAQVLNVLDIDAQRCVMLDDQLSYIEGAKKAGLRTVWVHPDADDSNGFDAAVHDVLEAGPILESWLH